MNEKRRDLKILIHSDCIWAQSGYSCEMDFLIRRLLKEGFQVAQASKAGLNGHWIDYRMDEGTLRMYPQVDDPHGSDTMFYGARHFKANVAISMIDTWVINPDWIRNLKSLGCKWIPYLPIDSNPVAPGVLRNLPLADKIITFSKFGQEQLKKSGFVSDMFYEGVDVNKLQPKDKMEARKKAEFPPDIFLWGMIAANKENPPRKSFQEALEAFKMFSDAHPEARLFCGTQQISPGGFPIREYAQHLGILDKLFFPDQLYMSVMATREDIETWYNSFDALLHPSATEGFGLTIVEAQACGIPAVIHDIHSMPELIIEGKTGEKAVTASRRWTNSQSFWETPDPKSIWWAMEKVYKKLKENPKQVRDDCRVNVVENFNIDTIFQEKWLPLFLDLQDKILPVGLTEPPQTPKI